MAGSFIFKDSPREPGLTFEFAYGRFPFHLNYPFPTFLLETYGSIIWYQFPSQLGVWLGSSGSSACNFDIGVAYCLDLHWAILLFAPPCFTTFCSHESSSEAFWIRCPINICALWVENSPSTSGAPSIALISKLGTPIISCVHRYHPYMLHPPLRVPPG